MKLFTNIYNIFANQLNNTSFFSCFKNSRYTRETSHEELDNSRYNELLLKEYSILKNSKQKSYLRTQYNIIDDFQIVLQQEFLKTNIVGFNTNKRDSIYELSYEQQLKLNSESSKLFVAISKLAYGLMNNNKLLFENKIYVLKCLISDTEYEYLNIQQIYFIIDIFTNIISYFYINKNIEDNFYFEPDKNKKQLNENFKIHKLFISGKNLYDEKNYYKYNINDLGPFVEDFNYKNIERNVSAFSYLLQTRINDMKKPVTALELKNANAILGGNLACNDETRIFTIDVSTKNELIHMLTLGTISSYVKDQHENIVKFSKQQLEAILFTLTETQLSLDEDINDHDSYKLAEKHKNIESRENAKKALQEIDAICKTGTLFQRLSGITNDYMFEFQICLSNSGNHIAMKYIEKTDKLELIEIILQGYYKLLASKYYTKLEIVKTTVYICNTLENIHPFTSNNNQTVSYILFQILLYQHHLWMTKSLYENWNILSMHSTSEVAKDILKLCTKNPKIRNDFSYFDHLNSSEAFRIACVIGDIYLLDNIIESDSKLLGSYVFIAPNKPDVHPVEFALKNGQLETAKYLLNYRQWELSKIQVHKIKVNFTNNNSYYRNDEIQQFLNEYMSLLIENTQY